MNSLRNVWPFSIFVSNDLKESKKLVHKLSLPESTKNFVFAIKVPEHDSTIYILAAQNLSERSAVDAECLIRQVRPGAVVAEVDKSVFAEAQVDETALVDSIPTSAFGVFMQCFVDKVDKEKYESVAGILVLKEVFGTSFNGHLLAAKRVAAEVGSSFMLLEPIDSTTSSGEDMIDGLDNSLVPRSRRCLVTNDMLKLLSPHISSVGNEIDSDSDEVPQFAQWIYCLLVELGDMFDDLPLVNARKMLCDVNRGESMDTDIISQLYLFQIAVEGLRIALNNAGRLPLKNSGSFVQLSSEEKSYAITADLLRTQAKKFKKVVAVIDASSLAGIRKHWRTNVPQEVKDLSEHMVQSCDDDEETNDSMLKTKAVVAVGAGATAIWGVSSLTKAITASPLFKIMTLKHKAVYLMKFAGPSKSTSLVKASLSVEKIRAVTQSILVSAEKTSFSAMRLTFYEIMRKRRLKPIRALPLATFGATLATCAGLLVYEDGIECAAVSLPWAPSIANLGRGVQNLHVASVEVRKREGNRIQEAIEALRQILKKVKYE